MQRFGKKLREGTLGTGRAGPGGNLVRRRYIWHSLLCAIGSSSFICAVICSSLFSCKSDSFEHGYQTEVLMEKKNLVHELVDLLVGGDFED